MFRKIFYLIVVLHMTGTLCAASEQEHVTSSFTRQQHIQQNRDNVYKKHLIWKKIGASVIAATTGTFAVTLLDSFYDAPTYPFHESVKWWLACIFGSGLSTFYTLCMETWPELSSDDKAYYIARLVVYYASIKGAYHILKQPSIQHFFIDDFSDTSHSTALLEEQPEALFNASGTVTVYKDTQPS